MTARARCFYCGSRRVYATWGGTVCPVCNGNTRHWRARLHRLDRYNLVCILIAAVGALFVLFAFGLGR